MVMKAMKASKKSGGVQTRCASVKKALDHSNSGRVQEMLSRTISQTIGTCKADRHPFGERFVAMIQSVLNGEQTKLEQDLQAKEAAFAELSPAKSTREAALEQAKAVASAKSEEFKSADAAVKEAAASVSAAAAAVKAAKKAQKSGDEELEGITVKKTMLEDTQRESLAPIVEGDAEDASSKVKAVLSTGKSFGFDASLLSTAAQVFERPAAERGAFDATCVEQLKEAFVGAVAKFDEQLAAGAPGKAERAAAVEQAEAAKATAEASQADLKEKAAAAKQAKGDAADAEKDAASALEHFMPDLKKVGDALDAAKQTLQAFVEGPQVAFGELKELKEGDFEPRKRYYETIDGLKCDREVIDACRTAVAGRGDGRVSTEDAKAVFAAIADGGKETRTERWSLRFCMQEFKWTEAAHDWMVEELKKVSQEDAQSPAKKARTDGAGYYETIDGFKCDRGIVDACREAMGGQGDGRVSVEDAEKVWAKAADGSKVTNGEKWTLRYCLASFNWTRAAHDYLLEQLQATAQ